MLKRNPQRTAMRTARGFTLLEVMVSVLVVAIGLLGLAKMQALALSSTTVSSSRSMVAVKASSLAAAMHGGRAYWAAGVAPASVTISGTTITDSSGVLSTTVADCTATSSCSAAQLAAFDVQRWASDMATQFPSHVTTVTCSTTVGVPVSCSISITWTEKAVVSVNQLPASAPSATNDQTYVLYVEP